MSAQYDVTAACANCGAVWDTWGISWHEPTQQDWPGGEWLLGKYTCPTCGEEQAAQVKSVNHELEADGEPSLTAGEREY